MIRLLLEEKTYTIRLYIPAQEGRLRRDHRIQPIRLDF